MEIRELFARPVDKRVANQGVAKVGDLAPLREELAEYIITETVERNLRTFLDLFTESMRTRGTDQALEAMAAWCSGFFGSGKSHFVKVLGHILAANVVDTETNETAADLFRKRIPDDSPQKGDIEARLHEIGTKTWCHAVLMDVKSGENLINPNSVAEILLSAFYETCGYSPYIRVARHELFMERQGMYERFKQLYQERHGVSWESDRENYDYHQQRVAELMAECAPADYPSPEVAAKALDDADQNVTITAAGFCDELMRFLDRAQAEHPQRKPHLVFILDELQQFIGEDNDRIEEVRTLVETLGGVGKGRVWIVATGQEALDRIFDRAGLKLQGQGKLDARFGCKMMLGTEDVQRVVVDRLLRKRPAHVPHLEALYRKHDGFLAEVVRLRCERNLPPLDQTSFVSCYPFLPYQPFLAQEVFDSMRGGTKLAGTPRSMLDVCHAILQRLADGPCDGDAPQLVSFDLVFDQIRNELYSDDFLGSHGVRAVQEADERLSGWSVSPTRVLKVLWLIQRLAWMPRTADCLARLLTDRMGLDLYAFASEVEATLRLLSANGYVGFDEATKSYRYLSADESDLEKQVLDRVAKLGVGDVRRRCREISRQDILTRSTLGEYRVSYGKTQTTFDFAVIADGEPLDGKLRGTDAGDEDGREMLLEFVGPLASASVGGIARDNTQQGPRGRRAWWVSADVPMVTERLKRLIALDEVSGDPKHTSGRSESYLRAVREKTEERDRLRAAIARDLREGLLRGQAYVAGEVVTFDGTGDLRSQTRRVFDLVIPNLFTRFAAADKSFDGTKDAERFLNSGIRPQDVATELGLFDTEGNLIPSHELVEPVRDCLRDREDAGEDLDGASILAYFRRTPFGWPEDLVRTLVSAMFRGGTVTVTAGGRTYHDYTEQAAHESLTKSTRFRKAQFRAAKTGLTHTQISEAAALLVAIGLPGVQPSATDLARAVRRKADELERACEKAEQTSRAGIPIAETYQLAETLCLPLADLDDPTSVVSAFLSKAGDWKRLAEFACTYESFVKAGRDQQSLVAEGLVTICTGNPPLARSSQVEQAQKALEDIAQVRQDRSVMERWKDYAEAAGKLEAAYRAVYAQRRAELVERIDEAQRAIEDMPEWAALPDEVRLPILKEGFGPSAPLGIAEKVDLSSAEALIEATKTYNLQHIDALKESVPYHEAIVASELRQAMKPNEGQQPAKTVEPVRKVNVMRIVRGRRIRDASELDATLGEVRTACEEALQAGDILELE